MIGTSRYAATLHMLSALAWLASVWATQEFITSLGISGAWPITEGLAISHAWAVALCVQWIFTEIETPIWYKRGDRVRFMVLAIDTLLNAGGLWYWFVNLPDSNVYRMLQDFRYGIDQAATVAQAQEEPDMLLLATIVLIAGLVLAFLPEYLKKTARLLG